MENTINLKQLTSLERLSTEFSKLSGDYLFTHITSDDITKARRLGDITGHEHVDGPIRIDGMSFLLCFSGQIDCEINLEPSTLRANCLAITPPGSMVEIKSIHPENLDCYILFVSTDFIRDINFDQSVLGSSAHISRHNIPGNIIEMSDSEAEALRDFFRLMHRISMSKNPENIYSKSIARCILAALFYHVFQMVSARIRQVPESKQQRTRRTTYVNDFMRLVHQHHTSERSVSFYAERLSISAKYLSLIVKTVTGRSATEIIDSYVILEAKNLLRFSDKNIQQVAYALNFPNQSSFGKYFKHLTGMSPSEYQRS